MITNNNVQLKSFIDNFHTAAEFLHIKANETDRAAAALEEIFQKYDHVARWALLATPYFASHGTDHAVRLAQIATNFIASIKDDGEPALPALATPECLVLLYAALMLHDIGMALTDGGALITTEVQKKQIVRRGHDERSLQFIEQELIPEDLTHWKAFWDTRGPGWPKSKGKNAFYLLARICKSHGDEPTEWLEESSFDHYRLRTKSEIRNFQRTWGSHWAKAKTIALTASTLLSLCDLCDLGKERFKEVPDEWKPFWIPEEPKARGLSFLHWAGHQVCEVSFERNIVCLHVSGYAPSDLKKILLLAHGPAADLYRWGNTRRLVDSLRKFVTRAFGGVLISDGTEREEVWGDIERKALMDDNFRVCWLGERANSVLYSGNQQATEFDKAVTVPLWWTSCACEWQVEIPDENHGRYCWLRFLARLKDQGLLVEDVVKVDTVPDDNLILVKLDPRPTSYELSSSFLAALRIAREVAFAQCPRFTRLHFAFKGSENFSRLYSGKDLDVFDGAIVIAEVRSPPSVQIEEYERIVERIKERRDTCLILFGEETELRAVTPLVKTQVIVSGDNSKIKAILRDVNRIRETDAGLLDVILELHEEEAPDLTPRVDQPSSPTMPWVDLYIRGNGAGLEQQILHGLRDEKPELVSKAIGQVIYIMLFDLLDLTTLGIKKRDLAQEYDGFQRVFTLLKPKPLDWEPVHKSMIETRLVVEDRDVLTPDPQAMFGKLRGHLIALSATALLIQLVIIYRLQAIGRIYNFGAESLVEDAFPASLMEQVSCYVYDPKVDFEVRVRIGLFFAELMAKQVSNGYLGLVQAISHIARPSPRTRLNDEDLLVFQIVYRIARANLSMVTETAIERLKGNVLALLGTLEAIASSERAGRRSQKISNALRTIFKEFEQLQQCSEGEGSFDMSVVMAFDISWKYAKSNGALRYHSKDFRVLGNRLGWNELARHIHGKLQLTESELARFEAWPAWKELRTRFLNITDVLTPAELRRTPATISAYYRNANLGAKLKS